MRHQSEGLKMKKKVMLAIDESESSYYALMWLLNNLKKSIDNTTLLIFSAQPLPSTNFTVAAPLGSVQLYFSATPSVNMFDSLQEKNKKVSLGILKKAEKICTAQGIDAETVLEFGDPKETICNAVSKNKISLLVMGDHVIGTFKRVFQGSISDYCMNNAKCPVLVVKKAC